MTPSSPSPRSIKQVLTAFFVLFFAGLCYSCMYASIHGVQGDQKVGKAENQQLKVDVVDGLAVVRELSGNKITLWGSVPFFEVKLHHIATQEKEWQLQINNAMPKALLYIQTLDGGEVTAKELPSKLPTQKIWSFSLKAQQTVTLSIGPKDHLETTPFKIVAMSDIQDGINKVQDLFHAMNQEEGVRVVLSYGDLTNDGGSKELENVQKKMEVLKVPFFSTLGNHELGERPYPWHKYFGRSNFSFSFHDVRFTLMDSGAASIDPLAYQWLNSWLEKGKDKVHIVGTHIPPLDPIGVRSGSFANRNEALKFLKLLAQSKVDLTIYGHVHSYYKFENAGIPAYISGGGGAFAEKFDEVGRHYLLIEIDPKNQTKKVTLRQIEDDQGNPIKR